MSNPDSLSDEALAMKSSNPGSIPDKSEKFLLLFSLIF
jgi:hypothetical protein